MWFYTWLIISETSLKFKFLQQLILNAKCHAIRDAQLIEKVDIKKEQLEEEKRLDEMMEVERRKALKEYEEREKAAHFERLKGAQVLQHQITDREQIRLLDEEKKDQETKVIINIFYHQFFRLLGGSLKLTFIWEFMKINKICPKILPVLNVLKKCKFFYINFVSFNFFFIFEAMLKLLLQVYQSKYVF